MDYCKITENKQAQKMGNPYKIIVSNPTEEKKALIAQMDGWLGMVYTDQPEYDPETQYLVSHWEEQEIEGVKKAVQVWEIKEIMIEE